MATKKQRDSAETDRRPKPADDAKVRASVEKIITRDRELLKRLAR